MGLLALLGREVVEVGGRNLAVGELDNAGHKLLAWRHAAMHPFTDRRRRYAELLSKGALGAALFEIFSKSHPRQFNESEIYCKDNFNETSGDVHAKL